MTDKPKQTIIPQFIIKMAKAIQDADQKKHQLIIMQRRACGKTEAYNIARGHLN